MFSDWLAYDIKFLIQILTKPSSLVEFSKMVVFLKLEDDPEIIEVLCDVIIRQKHTINTNDLLTITVNLSHTLNPAVENVLEAVNSEFVTRLDDNFDPD